MTYDDFGWCWMILDGFDDFAWFWMMLMFWWWCWWILMPIGILDISLFRWFWWFWM